MIESLSINPSEKWRYNPINLIVKRCTNSVTNSDSMMENISAYDWICPLCFYTIFNAFMWWPHVNWLSSPSPPQILRYSHQKIEVWIYAPVQSAFSSSVVLTARSFFKTGCSRSEWLSTYLRRGLSWPPQWLFEILIVGFLLPKESIAVKPLLNP